MEAQVGDPVVVHAVAARRALDARPAGLHPGRVDRGAVGRLPGLHLPEREIAVLAVHEQRIAGHERPDGRRGLWFGDDRRRVAEEIHVVNPGRGRIGLQAGAEVGRDDVPADLAGRLLEPDTAGAGAVAAIAVDGVEEDHVAALDRRSAVAVVDVNAPLATAGDQGVADPVPPRRARDDSLLAGPVHFTALDPAAVDGDQTDSVGRKGAAFGSLDPQVAEADQHETRRGVLRRDDDALFGGA